MKTSRSLTCILLSEWSQSEWATYYMIPTIRPSGKGNGNPLQCSCLENPRDGGAGGLPSMGSHRVGHDWSDSAAVAAAGTTSKYMFIKNNQCIISFDSQKQLKESGIIRTLLMKQELGISSRGTIARSWQSWDSKEREMSDKDLRHSSGSSAQYSVTA